VERLNQDGAHWAELEDLSLGGAREERGVDCQARDDQKVLQVQVTKVAGGAFWLTLSQAHEAMDAKTVNECVDELTRAIEKKAKKLAGPHRASIVLALDARDTADYTLARVVEAVQQRYGASVHHWGFQAIWVVGPTATLTKRLDV